MSVVNLPTYNKKDNIVPLIEEVRKELENYRFEVIVVDHSNPDSRAKAVQDAFAEDARIRVLIRDANPSLAQSIRSGIELSEA